MRTLEDLGTLTSGTLNDLGLAGEPFMENESLEISFNPLSFGDTNSLMDQMKPHGADSSGQTPDRNRASPCFYAIDDQRIETTNLVAWTQYGMFRREMFDDGVQFDESKPFDGPGWGFEDNDLAFQMSVKGYLNRRFYGVTYLHRAARSSIRILKQHGIDARMLYELRKQYVINKWAATPEINSGPLSLVRRVTMTI